MAWLVGARKELEQETSGGQSDLGFGGDGSIKWTVGVGVRLDLGLTGLGQWRFERSGGAAFPVSMQLAASPS
eukprot:75958-Prorocentrum_lima.AAC.1